MAPVILRYPLDTTGVSPNNLVQGEIHPMVRRKVRAIAPTYGAFFTESVVLVDTATQQPLTRGVDYQAVEMYEVPTAKFGKEVCAVLLITNENVGDQVALQYQAVGGDFSTAATAIAQMMENLSLDDRPIGWPSIIDKPSEYPPSHHLHDAGDIYGFEYLVHALERIRSALIMGDAASHDKIYSYLDNAIANLNQLIANGQAGLAAHIAATDPHPQYMTAAETTAGYVKQGGGQDQVSTSQVHIGWTNGLGLKAQVDATDLGSFAFQAWVTTQIANVINGAPVNLNTLSKLATAIGNDPAFATTMTNALALKAPLASPPLTGIPTAPTAAAGTSTTQLATTAFAKTEATNAMNAHLAVVDPHPQYYNGIRGNASFVKQGGGAGQLTNIVYIGWSGAKLKAQVDSSDLGNFAMESWVNNQIAALVDSSPSSLDTLRELATALGNDANFATTVTNSLSLKAPLASPNFSGNVSAGSFSGAGTGLTGTAAGLTAGVAISATTAATALRVASQDIGSRLANEITPATSPKGVRFDFVNAATANTAGNYAGLMTYAPWDGQTVSTGGDSYQLAFGSSAGVGPSGMPMLNIRKGVDATWNSWYSLWHSGNLVPSVASAAGTVALRDGSGYLQGTYAFFSDEGVSGTSGAVSGILTKRGDNYYRTTSAASVKAFLAITAADTQGLVYRSGDSMSGPLTMANTTGGIGQAAGDIGKLKVQNNSGAGDAAFIQFLRQGVYGAYFGLDTDNQWKVGGWSAGAVAYTILHSGNYNSYSPTLGGVGASGTWPINITGSASSVTSISSAQLTAALGYTPLKAGLGRNDSADVNGFVGSNGVYAMGASNGNAPASYGNLLQLNNSDVNTQLYMAYNGGLYYRSAASSSLVGAPWRTIWDSTNLTSLSQLSNNVGYVTAAGGVSQFANNAGYITAGGNITQFVNNAGYITAGGNITQFANNAGYATTGGGNAQFSNNANYVVNSGSMVQVNGSGMTVAGSITASGNVSSTSDARTKKDIVPITNALAKVEALNGITYAAIVPEGETEQPRRTGVIAQDVLKVLPEAVVIGASPEDMMSVVYGNMAGLFAEAIKELSAKTNTSVAALEAQVAALQEEVRVLKGG